MNPLVVVRPKKEERKGGRKMAPWERVEAAFRSFRAARREEASGPMCWVDHVISALRAPADTATSSGNYADFFRPAKSVKKKGENFSASENPRGRS
jgi:hypothetical protein